MKPVRWGILSTAKIGLERVLPGMKKSPWCEVCAIASRDEAAARRRRGALGIPEAYGSYEALLADPTIEAIYNPLPNHLHVPMTLEAAAAGKHVLCEKPIALTAAEAEQLRDTARQGAGHGGVHGALPPAVAARARAGARGRDRRRCARSRCSSRTSTSTRRTSATSAEIGGGGLYDIGCYAIVAGRFFFEAEPGRAVALIDRDPGFAHRPR